MFRRHKKKPQVARLEPVESRHREAYRGSHVIGTSHIDTRQHNTLDCLPRKNLPGFTLKRIEAWGGKYVNGIRFIYSYNGKEYASVEDRGSHDSPIALEPFVLGPGERINQVTINSGTWVDSLSFFTNKNRIFKIGTSTGGTFRDFGKCDWDEELIGLEYGVGGHIHHVRCIFRTNLWWCGVGRWIVLGSLSKGSSFHCLNRDTILQIMSIA